jgi:uncharacterized repeat protein (TIGR03837 family)
MQHWDIFCSVVDNFGDIGICWRLARQLVSEHGVAVRLWVDRLESFARLCPVVLVDATVQQVGSIEVRHWPSELSQPEVASLDIADVVIEAFGCELPENYIAALARRATPPKWINLEYLSAEAWVDECHRVESPHPRWPLKKTFFYPGFTPQTGGLIREQSLRSERAAFDEAAQFEFWTRIGVPHKPEGELRISLFCYDNPQLRHLLDEWSEGTASVRILATPGAATKQIADWLGVGLVPDQPQQRGRLSVQVLPFLSQPDYDRLLWSCDLNFVRGEDSFVRAQWAERPFVWQIYPQSEDAHRSKLEAFLRRYLDDAYLSELNTDPVRAFWLNWNSFSVEPLRSEVVSKQTDAVPTGRFEAEIVSAWRGFIEQRTALDQQGKLWAKRLDRQSDLANNLARFVQEK